MSEISDDEGIDVQEHVRKEVISPVLTGIKGSVKTFLIHLIFEEHGEDRFISGIDVMFPLTSERLSLQNIVPIHLGNEKYEALGFYESGGAWIRNQSEANKKDRLARHGDNFVRPYGWGKGAYLQSFSEFA